MLSDIPKSKRAYFVKEERYVPSGDRNDPYKLPVPRYYVMCRPVDPKGNRNDWYGTKTKIAHGPFTGEAGRAKAEEIARVRNETFHGTFG